MNTTPTAVTIFPDRARVTRTGRLTAQPGSQRIEIPNLPMALVPESVRATGKGAASAQPKQRYTVIVELDIQTEQSH